MEKNKIILYIILPCYNSEKTIARAIDSVKNQLSDEIKLLIINDGSSDKSKEIINGYIYANNNISYIEQKNSGLSKTLQVGINRIKEHIKDKYCYIARLDSDDEYTESGAINLLNVIKNTNHKYKCYNAPLLKNNDIIQNIKIHHKYLSYEDSLKEDIPFFFDSVSSIISLDIYDNKYWSGIPDRSGDGIPAMRIQKDYGLCITNIYFYVVHEEPYSLSRRLITKDYAKIALQTNLILLNEFYIPYKHIKRIRKKVGNSYYIIARYYAVLGYYKNSLHHLIRGIKYNPYNILYMGLVLACLFPHGYKFVNFLVKHFLFKSPK